MRYCSKCKRKKTNDCFHKSNTINSGYQTYCKSCYKVFYHPRVYAAAQRKRLSTPDGLQKHRQNVRKNRLQRVYNISIQEYENMLITQSGRCGLCYRPMSKNRWLAVDHCHTTNKIRGLLCSPCNRSLHSMEHDRTWFNKALNYLGYTE